MQVFLRFLQNEYQWSPNEVKEVFKKLSKDDVTTISLLGMCWNDVQAHFPNGMRRVVEKELKRRNMISQECHVFKVWESQRVSYNYNPLLSNFKISRKNDMFKVSSNNDRRLQTCSRRRKGDNSRERERKEEKPICLTDSQGHVLHYDELFFSSSFFRFAP